MADILYEDFVDSNTSLSSKDILKKCENVVRLRRPSSRRRAQPLAETSRGRAPIDVALASTAPSSVATLVSPSSPPPPAAAPPPTGDRVPLPAVDRC